VPTSPSPPFAHVHVHDWHTDMDLEAERVSERFDRVFWLGDFNYRINGTREMVDALLKGNMHEVCWKCITALCCTCPVLRSCCAVVTFLCSHRALCCN
jgi:hypothetical protein